MSKSTVPLFDAALDYVQLGLRVIALTGKMPNGKVHPRGIYDALNYDTLANVKTAGKFLDVFNHPDTTGIGILTGMPLYVVDIDGEEGAADYYDMTSGYDGWDTWAVKTGRGLHLYYASEHTFATRKLGPKLDFKAAGGYVAAPPSLHPEGHIYEWVMSPEEAIMAEMPAPLVRLLLEQAEMKAQRVIKNTARRTVRHKVLEDGMIWGTPLSLSGPIKALREAGEGNRNNMLHWATCVIREEGGGEEELSDLYDAAIECGLDPQEATRTIQSAMRGVKRGR